MTKRARKAKGVRGDVQDELRAIASSRLFRLLGSEARRAGVGPDEFAAGVLAEILQLQSRMRAGVARPLPRPRTEYLVQYAADMLWPEQRVAAH
jgi:hypothetical protein